MHYRKLIAALALVLLGMVAGSPVAVHTGYGLGVEAARDIIEHPEGEADNGADN